MNPTVLIAGVLMFQLSSPTILMQQGRAPAVTRDGLGVPPPNPAPIVDEIKILRPDGMMQIRTWRLDGSVEERIDAHPNKTGPTTDSTTPPVLDCTSDYQATTISYSGDVTHRLDGEGLARCLIGSANGTNKCKQIKYRMMVYEYDGFATKQFVLVVDTGWKITGQPPCGTSYYGKASWTVDRAGLYRADFYTAYSDGTNPLQVPYGPFNYPSGN